MAARFSKGDRVRWRTSGGSAAGTIERVITSRVKVGGRTVAATADDPRYLAKNAETGKTTILKGGSLRSAAPPRDKARPAPQPLRPAHPLRRWAAPLALIAAVLVVGAIFLISTGDSDDDDGGDAAVSAAETTTTESTETATEATTPPDDGATSAAVQDALADQPLALQGVPPIAEQRLGDDQEARAFGFNRRYDRTLSRLDALEQASTEDAGGVELAQTTDFVGATVEIDQAITNAFVKNSFSTGDPAAVLAQKTQRTEVEVKAQIQKAAALNAPPDAADLQAAFTASWKAALDYLGAVSAAIDSRNQSALDQALRDGRAAATRTGARIRASAVALQEQAQSAAAS